MEYALGSIGAGIWDLDVVQNRAHRTWRYDEVFGYAEPVAHWSHETFLEHVVPEDREHVDGVFRRALAEGREWNCECRILRVDGEMRWIAMRGRSCQDEAGKTVRMFGLVQDITTHKEKEDAHKQVSDLSAAIIANTKEGIVVLGTDMRYRLWNSSMEQMTGVRAEEVIGRHPHEVFPEMRDNGFLANLEERARRGKPEEVELPYFVARTGRSGWMSDQSSPLRTAEGEVVGMISLVRDITLQKKAEEESSRLAGELEQAQKMDSIGRLAGGVAHDFNNLITIILGHADLLVSKTQPGHPLRRSAEVVVQAGEHAAELTRQMLAFSRKNMAEVRRADLNRIVTNTHVLLSRLIGEDIDLQLKLTPELRAVMVDEGQIDQVLMNLVANARDAIAGQGEIVIETENGSPDQAGDAPIPQELAAGGVILRVRDNGAGMNEETRRRVFEPFYTTKEKGKGTGLGLATVAGIVERAGGWISVESEEGQGSTVTVILPPAAEGAATAAMVECDTWRQGGTETILLVEDETGVREWMAEALRADGYTVLPMKDAREAIQTAERYEGDIDLLLTDVILPQMAGREVARAVSRVRPEAGVLYMSGYPEDVVVKRGVLERGEEYLPKPFRRPELLYRVRQVLDQRGEAAD